MKNVEYQENIAEVGEVKIRRKNMKSYVLALELCNKVMKTTGIDNIPSEDHTNLWHRQVNHKTRNFYKFYALQAA